MLRKEIYEAKKKYIENTKTFSEIEDILLSLDKFIKDKVDEDFSIKFNRIEEEQIFGDNKKNVVCYNIFLSKKEKKINLFSLFLNKINENDILLPAIFADKLFGISPFETDMELINNEHDLGLCIENVFKNPEFFSYINNI